MRTGRVLVHVGGPCGPELVPSTHQSQQLPRGGYTLLGDLIHKELAAQALPNRQGPLSPSLVEQVPDLLVVDLDEGHREPVSDPVFEVAGLVEESTSCPWDNAHEAGIGGIPCHGVGLAARGPLH